MAALTHINLAPIDGTRASGRQRRGRFRRTAMFFVTLAATVIVTWHQWSNEAELARQVAELQRNPRPTSGSGSELQKSLDRHRRALAVIEGIGGLEANHAGILEEIAVMLPDSVVLTRFELSGNSLTLRGRTTNHATIGELLRKLDLLAGYADTELLEIRPAAKAQTPTGVEFSVRCRAARKT